MGVSSIFPPISSILMVASTVLSSEKFIKAIEISLRTFALGMTLALLVGIGLGALMARVKTVREILGTWVNIFVSAPISALVPILMGILGIGEATVVATVFLFAVFVIILDTQVGISKADRSLVEMGHSFGANRYQIFTKILILSALPEILAGIRLGVIRGVKGVVIGQLLISIIGVGELFELYSKHFLMEEFWSLVIVVFAFALLLSEAIAYCERRVEYYAGSR
ncbi:MAG: ABC transporter permease subunit [Proteobacteria bacterium]|nr:ABC transporter permease subunit [Pseudomonadota bacterium]MBU2226861.1 ABC transporter permease subunit [Pseudomonadota bacterium]MBU2261739.1 ABC transporter permease subunit [Pseudomonadota bacterium]